MASTGSSSAWRLFTWYCQVVPIDYVACRELGIWSPNVRPLQYSGSCVKLLLEQRDGGIELLLRQLVWVGDAQVGMVAIRCRAASAMKSGESKTLSLPS